MAAPLRDQGVFLREAWRRYKTTGAVAPSSRFLARALTAGLAEKPAPAAVLEVGPGTGAVTREIVRRLGPDDRLDLVELNEHFARTLQEKFTTDPSFSGSGCAVQVHTQALEDFEAPCRYNVIVSGLPLNNFPPPVVRSILEKSLGLLAPGGTLSYFEYIFLRRLRRLMALPSARPRLKELDAVLNDSLRRNRFRSDPVLLNLPPAWAHHLRVASGSPLTPDS